MSDVPDDGEPVQVIRLKNDAFELDTEALGKILLHDDIRDRPVVIVSIGGGYRKGKSFMLNFFLRYLAADDTEAGNWLDALKDDDLTGFQWKCGKERVTTGVWLWSRPFMRHIPDVGETAVLVMDTQGLYDRHTSVKGCATMFALSTLISSMQIYNLQNNLQLGDFEHLQFFGEYAKLAIDGLVESKPFQRLTLLIRDWPYPDDNEYGWDGGEKLLRSFFSEGLSKDMKNIWSNIRTSFEKVDCCLLPHPGNAVATSRNFTGNLHQMDKQFVEQLEDFIPQLLDVDNLVVKKMNGHVVTCAEVMTLFESYCKAFSGSELPEPKAIFTCMVEATNLSAFAAAEKFYFSEMEKALSAKPMESSQLTSTHKRLQAEALKLFSEVKKMGGESSSLPFVKQLESAIAVKYATLAEENIKNVNSIVKSVLLTAKSHYTSGLSNAFGDEYVEPRALLAEHIRLVREASAIFQEAADLGADAAVLFEFFEDHFSKAQAENKVKQAALELTTLKQTVAEAESKVVSATAEKESAISKINDLEAKNANTQAKMASLEAQLTRLSLAQQTAPPSGRHDDSGFSCGYGNSPSYFGLAPSPIFSSVSTSPYSPLMTPNAPRDTPASYTKPNVHHHQMIKPQIKYEQYDSNASLHSAVSHISVSSSTRSSASNAAGRKAASDTASVSSERSTLSGRSAPRQHWVNGYTKANGTVVQGYWRGGRGGD